MLSDTLDIQPSSISAALQVVLNKHVLEPQVLNPLFAVFFRAAPKMKLIGLDLILEDTTIMETTFYLTFMREF